MCERCVVVETEGSPHSRAVRVKVRVLTRMGLGESRCCESTCQLTREQTWSRQRSEPSTMSFQEVGTSLEPACRSGSNIATPQSPRHGSPHLSPPSSHHPGFWQQRLVLTGIELDIMDSFWCLAPFALYCVWSIVHIVVWGRICCWGFRGGTFHALCLHSTADGCGGQMLRWPLPLIVGTVCDSVIATRIWQGCWSSLLWLGYIGWQPPSRTRLSPLLALWRPGWQGTEDSLQLRASKKLKPQGTKI